MSNAVGLALGSTHSCALLDDGSTKCWGQNNWGQLGNGTFTDSLVPVTVTGSANAVSISGGSSETVTCVVLADGKGQCWGGGNDYLLAAGNTTTSTVPIDILGLNGIETLYAASSGKSCATLSDSRFVCWGSGIRGEMHPFKPNQTISGSLVIGTN